MTPEAPRQRSGKRFDTGGFQRKPVIGNRPGDRWCAFDQPTAGSSLRHAAAVLSSPKRSWHGERPPPHRTGSHRPATRSLALDRDAVASTAACRTPCARRLVRSRHPTAGASASAAGSFSSNASNWADSVGEVTPPVSTCSPAPPCASTVPSDPIARRSNRPRWKRHPGAGLLRAVRVPQLQNSRLSEDVRGPQACRMLRVALDLGRTSHVALDQHSRVRSRCESMLSRRTAASPSTCPTGA